jgi:D-alanine-D-alanine ligase-like ATP-grasp enzyme
MNILVLGGGNSPEREVSLRSANAKTGKKVCSDGRARLQPVK